MRTVINGYVNVSNYNLTNEFYKKLASNKKIYSFQVLSNHNLNFPHAIEPLQITITMKVNGSFERIIFTSHLYLDKKMYLLRNVKFHCKSNIRDGSHIISALKFIIKDVLPAGTDFTIDEEIVYEINNQ